MTTAAERPDNAFFCAPPAPGRAYFPDGIEYTYAQTRGRVLELRERYATAGYGHGHRVALLLENRPEFFFHYLALNGLGCGIVPINPDYQRDDCRLPEPRRCRRVRSSRAETIHGGGQA